MPSSFEATRQGRQRRGRVVGGLPAFGGSRRAAPGGCLSQLAGGQDRYGDAASTQMTGSAPRSSPPLTCSGGLPHGAQDRSFAASRKESRGRPAVSLAPAGRPSMRRAGDFDAWWAGLTRSRSVRYLRSPAGLSARLTSCPPPSWRIGHHRPGRGVARHARRVDRSHGGRGVCWRLSSPSGRTNDLLHRSGRPAP
jgi:hypothetical protein